MPRLKKLGKHCSKCCFFYNNMIRTIRCKFDNGNFVKKYIYTHTKRKCLTIISLFIDMLRKNKQHKYNIKN